MNLLISIIRWKGIKRLIILFIVAIVIVIACVINDRYTRGLIEIKSDVITEANMQKIYLNWERLEEKGIVCDLGTPFQDADWRLLSYTDAKLIEPYGYDKSVYIVVPDKTKNEFICETELKYDGCYERVGIIDAVLDKEELGRYQTKFGIISKYCVMYAKFNDASGTDREFIDVLNDIISSIE